MLDCQRTTDLQFWDQVNKNGPLPNSYPELGVCWLWTGNTNNKGYGIFNRSIASRFALILALKRPTLLCACHICDNPLCVRNDTSGTYEINGHLYPRKGHLFEGSYKANYDDCKNKGRNSVGNRNGKHSHPETAARGETAGAAKLTEKQIYQIRTDFQWVNSRHTNAKKLAEEYGVSRMTIHNIIKHKYWNHI